VQGAVSDDRPYRSLPLRMRYRQRLQPST